MSFFKSLILAIMATLFLTYVFGTTIIEMLDVNIYMGNEVMEPLKAIGVAALVAVFLVLAALAVVLSVFGSVIFIGLLIVGGIAMVMLGVFWPLILIGVCIWALTRDSKNKAHPSYS